jgi:hypothetical protein
LAKKQAIDSKKSIEPVPETVPPKLDDKKSLKKQKSTDKKSVESKIEDVTGQKGPETPSKIDDKKSLQKQPSVDKQFDQQKPSTDTRVDSEQG